MQVNFEKVSNPVEENAIVDDTTIMNTIYDYEGYRISHISMMPAEEYDLAGFTVGIVDEKKILDINRAKAGDVMPEPNCRMASI